MPHGSLSPVHPRRSREVQKNEGTGGEILHWHVDLTLWLVCKTGCACIFLHLPAVGQKERAVGVLKCNCRHWPNPHTCFAAPLNPQASLAALKCTQGLRAQGQPGQWSCWSCGPLRASDHPNSNKPWSVVMLVIWGFSGI